MSSIILITTYNRPDYLRLTLEHLSAARGASEKEIWLCIDRGRSLIREFYEVLVDFKHLNILTTIREPHTYHGNSYNTLEAYKEAYNTTAEYVYLIEDDVLVQPDFFEWHEAVQEKCNPMASVAYRCRRNSQVRTDIVDPTAFFTSQTDYASIGVGWRRENLREVVKHAVPEYYGNPTEYLRKHFPNYKFADSHTEQDGLIQRILDVTHERVAWSYAPYRCFHIGFSGYNRPRGSRFTYQELKEIIHDPEKVKMHDKDFGDMEAVPTEPTPAWDASKLHCVQEFE